MTGNDRRGAILDALRHAEAPLSGTELARRFGVSRQVVVQDVALLRTQGNAIVATNRGYVMAGTHVTRPTRLYKCFHDAEHAEEELDLIVDLGGRVEDVQVNHRAYGRLTAKLDVGNRADVQRFMEDIRTGKSHLLSTVTSGYHFHTVSAADEATLDAIGSALEQGGFIAQLLPHEREVFAS